MSKRGVSFGEKKERMLQLFYERKEFFQLKELERIAPKEKGITANSVKEVIQTLVDDGSVETDKVGGSVYFWAFPSKLVNAKKRKLEEIQDSLETNRKRLKLVVVDLQKAQIGRENTVDSTEVMVEISNLEKRKLQLEQRLKQLKNEDSGKIENMKNEAEPVKNAANRWTDNIFAIKSWCKNKFMIEDSTLNKQFKIPEDLDYLE